MILIFGILLYNIDGSLKTETQRRHSTSYDVCGFFYRVKDFSSTFYSVKINSIISAQLSADMFTDTKTSLRQLTATSLQRKDTKDLTESSSGGNFYFLK